MRFYTQPHQYYCGIDLHARAMYVCILDAAGNKLVHRNIPAQAAPLLRLLEPYRPDVVVGVECMFTWYWLADLCEAEGLPFVLGHALYMKAVHGGKAKNDRIDSHQIAAILRGGNFPLAYVYPRAMRSTRDLLRRRTHFVRKRAELLAHIRNTNWQYNLPDLTRSLAAKANRVDVLERFSDPSVAASIQLDLELIDTYDRLITEVQLKIMRAAKRHDADAVHRLRSIPGVGKVLSLTILYEVGDISRFDRVQQFASYCRLVKPQRSSAGKLQGHAHSKIGNPHLKWAFSEAATTFIRYCPEGRRLYERLARKHGKGKALSVLAHKLGRATYFMLRRQQTFDIDRLAA